MKSIEEDSVPETMDSNKSHENEGKGDDFTSIFLLYLFIRLLLQILPLFM